MFNKFICFLFIFVCFAQTQTNSFTISWDHPVTVNNLTHYHVYRSAAAPADSLIAKIPYPRNSYVDRDIVKGTLYYYRVQAFNGKIASDFSEHISAAIPKIGVLPNITISQGQSFLLFLNDIIDDPDDALTQLAVSFNDVGPIKLQQKVDVIEIRALENYVGSKIITISVKDKSGFYDKVSFLLKVENYLNKKEIDCLSYSYNKSDLEVSWISPFLAKSWIEFGLSPDFTERTKSESDFNKEHSISLSNLKKDTSYYFRIVTEDQKGRINFTDVLNVSTRMNNNVLVFPVFTDHEINKNETNPFKKLPSNNKLQIYNLSGNIVFRTDNISPSINWLIANNPGEKIKTGLYIYCIIDPKHLKRQIGKVVILN